MRVIFKLNIFVAGKKSSKDAEEENQKKLNLWSMESKRTWIQLETKDTVSAFYLGKFFSILTCPTSLTGKNYLGTLTETLITLSTM